VLYAYARGNRSSRAIERHCRQDVAYRVITGNLVPDHVTITRFVGRHEQALSELFTEVLKLCQKAGLVKAGVVSIDGTRIAGNCNPDVNCKFEQLARESLARRSRPMRRRMRSTARREAMSCPRSCAPGRGGASSFGTPRHLGVTAKPPEPDAVQAVPAPGRR